MFESVQSTFHQNSLFIWTIAAGAYPQFLKHEAARSIFTPLGQDASPLLGFPNVFPNNERTNLEATTPL